MSKDSVNRADFSKALGLEKVIGPGPERDESTFDLRVCYLGFIQVVCGLPPLHHRREVAL